MVSPQATQNPPQSHGDSVRITAEIRRRILVEHYTEKLAYQQAVVASERADRSANKRGTPMFTRADVAVSNTIAVLQDISATLKSFGDENRDFPEVTQ